MKVFSLGFATRVLAVVGVIALILLVVLLVPWLVPQAQTEWSKIQPPRCATAQDCVFANDSCCSNASGNWTCAALDAKCAPNYAARVAGCRCGNGVCAANYSCEPLHPTATVELPPFPPEDLEPEASVVPSTAQIANPASVNCEQQNGTLEIISLIEAPFGQAGYCFFGDGTACEEWAFFRGECEKGVCNFTCIGIGSRSEGWMDCNGKFLGYANCA